MFLQTGCSVQGCGRPSAFLLETCLEHAADPRGYAGLVQERLAGSDRLADLNLEGLEADGLDFRGRRIRCLLLSHARLRGARFEGARVRLLFLDFASLTDCSFDGCKANCLVLGGAVLERCSFRSTDLLRCNFLGVRGRDCVFDGSDLYASRFTSAVLERTSFRDCNLKRVRFEGASLSGVDFQASNTEEAFFQ